MSEIGALPISQQRHTLSCDTETCHVLHTGDLKETGPSESLIVDVKQ